MSQAEEMFEAGKNDQVVIYDQKGKPIFRIPLWLAIILIIAAPQLLVVVLVAMALEIISVRQES